jgi:hypothetical protein
MVAATCFHEDGRGVTEIGIVFVIRFADVGVHARRPLTRGAITAVFSLRSTPDQHGPILIPIVLFLLR